MIKSNPLFFENILEYISGNINISPYTFLKLETITNSYYSYLISIDKLVDHEILTEDHGSKNPLQVLTDNHVLCIRTIIELFGNESHVFDIKSKYTKIFFDALEREKSWNFDTTILKKEDFELIAVQKHIPVFFIVELIKLLHEDYKEEEVKNMLSHIFKFMQMFDDITDIKIDLSEQQFTYAISITNQFLKNHKDSHPDNNDYMHRAFFFLEELSDPQFDYMREQLDCARNIAINNGFNKIIIWIDEAAENINEWKSRLEELRNV